jgi:hypothetical protein
MPDFKSGFSLFLLLNLKKKIRNEVLYVQRATHNGAIPLSKFTAIILYRLENIQRLLSLTDLARLCIPNYPASGNRNTNRT